MHRRAPPNHQRLCSEDIRWSNGAWSLRLLELPYLQRQWCDPLLRTLFIRLSQRSPSSSYFGVTHYTCSGTIPRRAVSTAFCSVQKKGSTSFPLRNTYFQIFLRSILAYANCALGGRLMRRIFYGRRPVAAFLTVIEFARELALNFLSCIPIISSWLAEGFCNPAIYLTPVSFDVSIGRQTLYSSLSSIVQYTPSKFAKIVRLGGIRTYLFATFSKFLIRLIGILQLKNIDRHGDC